MLIDDEAAALVGGETGGGEVEPGGGAGAPDRVQRLVGDHVFAAVEDQTDAGAAGVLILLDGRDGLVQTQRDAVLAQMIGQRFGDFAVDERQQAGAAVDERDAHAEDGEHRGVLAANHARADHRERARQ